MRMYEMSSLPVLTASGTGVSLGSNIRQEVFAFEKT